MTDYIGQWAHRASGGRSHLIESQIEDRFYMRCGHVMVHQLGKNPGGMLVIESGPSWGFPACLKCTGISKEDQTLNTRSTYP